MKKLFLSILVLIFFAGLIAQIGKNDQVTGTTTNSWVITQTLYTGRFYEKNIMISNTGSDSNDISWRIRKYISEDAITYKQTTATDLSDSDNIEDSVNNPWWKITIEIKTTVTDSVSTYAVDWILMFQEEL